MSHFQEEMIKDSSIEKLIRQLPLECLFFVLEREESAKLVSVERVIQRLPLECLFVVLASEESKLRKELVEQVPFECLLALALARRR